MTARLRVAAESSDLAAILRELVAGQCEVLTELRALRAQLRRQAAAAPLADRLVQATYALLESETFTAPQLLALADSPLSTRLELRAVIEDVVRDIDQPGTGRRLGRFLAANTQHECEGLRLVSLGKTREGLVYRVELATETRRARNWQDETL